MVLEALERMHAHLTAAVVSNDLIFLQVRLDHAAINNFLALTMQFHGLALKLEWFFICLANSNFHQIVNPHRMLLEIL